MGGEVVTHESQTRENIELGVQHSLDEQRRLVPLLIQVLDGRRELRLDELDPIVPDMQHHRPLIADNVQSYHGVVKRLQLPVEDI